MDEEQELPLFTFGEFEQDFPPISMDDIVQGFPPFSFDALPEAYAPSPTTVLDEVALPNTDGPDRASVLGEVAPPDADAPNPTTVLEETDKGTITVATILMRASAYNPQSARLKRLLAGLDIRYSGPAGREVKWVYRINAEGALITASGSQSETPCSRCWRGQGPFTECVAIAGEAYGSCGNCHYNQRGSLCSFRVFDVDPGPGVTHGGSAFAATTVLPGLGNLLSPANPASAAPAMTSAAQPGRPFTGFHANTVAPGLAPPAIPASVATSGEAAWSTLRLRRTARALRIMADNYISEAANYQALADLYEERDDGG